MRTTAASDTPNAASPKALGRRARPWVDLHRGAKMADALDLGKTACEQIGADVLLTLTKKT